MKKAVIYSCVFLFLSNCAGTAKINNVLSNQDFRGQDVKDVLSYMHKEGLYCERNKNLESDVRLKTLTDGTLKDVKFHTCYYQENAQLGMCVKSTYTHIVSQYDKVLKVNGNNSSNACIYDH